MVSEHIGSSQAAQLVSYSGIEDGRASAGAASEERFSHETGHMWFI